MIKKTFLESFKFLKGFLKTDWIYFSILILTAEIMQRYVMFLAEEYKDNAEMTFLSFLLSLSVGLSVTLYYYFIVPLRSQQALGLESKLTSFWVFTAKSTIPVTIESLRVMARLLIWSTLIIVPLACYTFTEDDHWLNNVLHAFTVLATLPAIINYCAYSFVPFIVITHPKYKTASIDPLILSKKISKGSRFFILISIVCSISFEFVNSYIRTKYSTFDALHLAIPLQALCIFLVLFFNIVLFHIYRLKMSEHT